MLYNAIEGAVAGWSRNSLPILIKLFGVPVTVKRQVSIEEVDNKPVVPEPEPVVPEPVVPEPVVPEPVAPEPEPEPVVPEPEPEPAYVPPVPSAPSGFMGSLYGGAISFNQKDEEPAPPEADALQEPETTATPVEPAEQGDDDVSVQEAVESVYGSMAGDVTIQDDDPKYREETFETVIIPPRRDWVTAGTRNIGGFEAVEVFANNDLLPDDKVTFKRSDGALFHYRVLHDKTLGITEELLVKTFLTPIEGEDSHGRR